MLFAVLFATLAAPATMPVSGNTPVLTRLSTSGFSIIGRTEACAIFSDHVEIRRTLWVPNDDSIHTDTSYPISFEGNLAAYIDAAAKGERSTDIGPTDVPQLHYHAYRTVSAGQVEQLDLGSRLDAQITHNAALEAQGLKAFIDAHCPPLSGP